MPQRELSDRVQGIRGRDAAGGIPRKIHDQRASARADQGGDALSVQSPHFIESVADRDRPGESHDRRVDREARVRHEDLITHVEHREEGVEHHWLCARNDDDVLGRSSPDATPGERRGDRIAQDGQPGRIYVTGVTLAQGPDPCLDYVGRRRPVRLADLEMDHMPAGVLESTRRYEHLECAFA